MQNPYELIYRDLEPGSFILVDFYFDEWNGANIITQINYHSKVEALQLHRIFTPKGWINQVCYFSGMAFVLLFKMLSKIFFSLLFQLIHKYKENAIIVI